ncbi:conserved hypothetical protein [Burkholderiales bacterium]|nr:conserved hypothetical protein [Burkholderiales bacterium]
MRYVDVFNGDADGLCALHQLRLAEPVDGELVTGLKREIDLLDRVHADAQTVVTVLDLSLDRNRAALLRLLSQGANVHYVDHHIATQIPTHPRLRACIDTSPSVCTSILVDRQLGGRFRPWAIVAAFGDGLQRPALQMAGAMMLDEEQQANLRTLGEALNYNAYGETEADVAIHPRALYGLVHRYVDPLEFAAREPIVEVLVKQIAADLEAAMQLAPIHDDDHCSVRRVPDLAWGRRVMGTLANRLADQDPRRTCAVLKEIDNASFRVSVRVPRAFDPSAGDNADQLCRTFGGLGRAGAAGIERLPADRLDEFVSALCAAARRWTRSLQPTGK